MDLLKNLTAKNHHFSYSLAFTLLNEIRDTGKQNIQIGRGAVHLQLVIYLMAHTCSGQLSARLYVFYTTLFCFHQIGVDCFTSVSLDGMPWTRPVLNGLKSWKNYQECGVNRQVKYNVLHNQVKCVVNRQVKYNVLHNQVLNVE